MMSRKVSPRNPFSDVPRKLGRVRTVVYGGLAPDRAELWITRTEIAHGRYTVTGRWEGPATAPLEVCWYLLSCHAPEQCPPPRESGFPREVNLFGYPLRLIESEFSTLENKFSTDRAYYARTDVGFGLPALWHRLRRGWKRASDALTARLVLTLAVWGLAFVPPGDVPDWFHVGKRRP